MSPDLAALASTFLGQRRGVIVSGGAPTLHLAAGALCGFQEKGLSFQAVAAAGAGALPGLLYLAPARRPDNPTANPAVALQGVVNMNIHDAIYDLIPNNFKVFFKYGPFADPFYRFSQFIKRVVPVPDSYGPDYQRLVHDWIDFVTAAVAPTTLTYRSPSVLTRVQVINELVDWNALRTSGRDFFLNTFNMETQRLQPFTKLTLTAEAFYAALAMPWLYPPTRAKTDGPLYTEGASHDPSGIETMLEDGKPTDAFARPLDGLDAVLVLDTVPPDLWTDPESLYEALELAIMDPIVTLTENIAALYSLQDMVFNEGPLQMPKLYRLPFKFPPWEGGKLLEWRYSTARALWDAGHDAAVKFCDDLLSSSASQEQIDAKYRYFRTLVRDSREGDFLTMFGDPFKGPDQTIPVPRPGTF
jgi:NTE family protein